jgi:type IV secretion system protein VirB9
MKAALLLAGLSLALAGPVWAAVSPKPGPGDPHIQTVEYDAQQVVVLRVALNYALTLEFSPDERIENVSVGNSAVWQVAADKSANRLFVKPTQLSVDTDMTVVTDTRLYAFELTSSPSLDPAMAFVVQFHYPSAPQPREPVVASSDVVAYRFAGARELWPSAMQDDGRSTSIVWPDTAVIPAVFLIGPDGKRALANGEVRDGRFVINQVAERFIFEASGKTAVATRRVKTMRKP